MQAMDHLLKRKAISSPASFSGCDVEGVQVMSCLPGWMCIERAEHKEGFTSPTALSFSSGSVTRAAWMLALRPVRRNPASVLVSLLKWGFSVIAELLQEAFVALLKLSHHHHKVLCVFVFPLFPCSFSYQPGCWLDLDHELDLHTACR